MKAALFLFLLAVAPAAAQTNPLSKVIQLMDDLFAKVVKEGEAEDLAFREYTNWCDDAASNKRFEIKTGESKKDELEASIGKLTSDIGTADTEIEKLAASIATSTKDLNDATVIRE
jgi:chromosome segregation ATPase